MQVVKVDLTHQQRASKLENENNRLRSQLMALRGYDSMQSDAESVVETPRKKRRRDSLVTKTQQLSMEDNDTIAELKVRC